MSRFDRGLRVAAMVCVAALVVGGCPPPTDNANSNVNENDNESSGLGDGTRSVLLEPAPAAPAGGFTLLNEVRFTPGDGESPFVELKVGADFATLAGMALENEDGKKFELPEDTPARGSGEFLLIVFDGQTGLSDGVVHGGGPEFLNAASGVVRLLSANGGEQDSVAWGEDRGDSVRLGNGGVVKAPMPGMSISRAPRSTAVFATDDWYVTDPPLPTPGAANRLPGVEMLLPVHGSLLESGVHTLSWYPAREAKSYFVQLARDAVFSDVIGEKTVMEPSFETTLEPGEYFWRVQAILGDGVKTDFSPVCRIEVTGSYDAYFADAESKSRDRSAQLGRVVPLYAQRKDTYMLHLESEHADGAHAWNAPHTTDTSRWSCPSDAYNCGLASTSMVNGFFAGADSSKPYLSQDRIGMEIYTKAPNFQAGPECDLNSGQGTSVQQQAAALQFALGVTPTAHGPGEGLTPQEFLQFNFRKDLQDGFRARFSDAVRVSINANRPVLFWIAQPGASFSHAVVAVSWAKTKPRGDVWIGINDPWQPMFYWLPLRSMNVGVYWLIPEGATATADNPQYTMPPGGGGADDDSDGISNFDEIIRFETNPKYEDTDRDCLKDLDEIRSSVFNEKHGWGPHWLKTGFSDGKARKTGRPELIVDSDNGGVADFLEIGDLSELFNPLSLKDIYDASDDKFTITGTYSQQNLYNPHFASGGENYFDEKITIEFTVHGEPNEDPKLRGRLKGTCHVKWTDEGWYRTANDDGPCPVVQTYSPPQEWDTEITGTISCYRTSTNINEPGASFNLSINKGPGADSAQWHEVCEGYFHDQVNLGGFGTYIYGHAFGVPPYGHSEKYITRENLRGGDFSFDITTPADPGSNNDMGFTRETMDIRIQR